MGQSRCIYCGAVGPAGNEHVISRLLFDPGPNTFTMQEVCNQCNTGFGRELEEDLRRDSLEGLFSSMYGIKASSEIVVYNRRIQISTDGSLHPVLAKALPSLDLTDTAQIGQGRFETQIIIERPSGNRHIFPVARLDRNAKSRLRSMPSDSVAYLVLESEADELDANGVIGELSLYIPDDRRFLAKPLQINFEFEQRIDKQHFRAIAKNAFNVFARTLLLAGSGKVIYDGFHEIKKFIQTGEGECPVKCIEADLGSTAHGFYPQGYPMHSVGWGIEDEIVKAKMQFFNLLLYEVPIGPAFEFVPPSSGVIGYGFVIDIRERKEPSMKEVIEDN